MAQGPATTATELPPICTVPEGVGIETTLFSCLSSRLTSLKGLLTGMHSTTPDMPSSVPTSTAPLLPVIPIAVRAAPGIGWAFIPADSRRWQTARICSSVAWASMTTSILGLLIDNKRRDPHLREPPGTLSLLPEQP